MSVSFLLALSVFVEEIYTVTYTVMFVVAGKAVTYGKQDVVGEVTKTMKMMPELLIKRLFLMVLPVCLLVFFLTHRKVSRQFKQKERLRLST